MGEGLFIKDNNSHHGTPELKTLLLCEPAAGSPGPERDKLVRDLVETFHGREIDKTEGFLLMFQRPVDAVGFALAYHEDLARLVKLRGKPAAARIGIHLGEVFLHENDAQDVARGAKRLELDGLAKPMAARLMSLATAGQTLLTRGAFDLARRAAVGGDQIGQKPRWLSHGEYVFKGVIEPVQVFEVGMQGCAPLTPPLDSSKVKHVPSHNYHGWRPARGLKIPNRDNWLLEEKMGDSLFGEVWLAQHEKTHDRKVFKFCFQADRLRGLRREVNLFRTLKKAYGDRRDIAKILDWNFIEEPYFIEAEYTQEGNLQEWSDSLGGMAAIPLEMRLELLAQIAEALSAAHAVGVLHKGLKPTHILIAEDGNNHPRALLTGFGTGRYTNLDGSTKTEISIGNYFASLDEGASISEKGTYIAPEIMAGKAVTIRADLFALGVLFYQVIKGDLVNALPPLWKQNIDDPILREDIGALVQTYPELRLSDAGEVVWRLRNLETRRGQRAEEERERLEAEQAHGDLQKAQRRTRLVSGVAILLFVLLAATTFQLGRSAQKVKRETQQASNLSDFLIEVLSTAELGTGDSVPARDLLDRGVARIDRELANEPHLRAKLLESMAEAYRNMGLNERALSLQDRAASLLKEEGNNPGTR